MQAREPHSSGLYHGKWAQLVLDPHRDVEGPLIQRMLVSVQVGKYSRHRNSEAASARSDGLRSQ